MKKENKILTSAIISAIIAIIIIIWNINKIPSWHTGLELSYMNKTIPNSILQEVLPFAYIEGILIILICCITTIFLLKNWHRTIRTAKGQVSSIPIQMEEDNLEKELLKIQINDHTITYNDTILIKSRTQVILVLEKLIEKDTHTLHVEELNSILGENYYDGSDSSRKRVNTLKHNMKKALCNTPFDIKRINNDFQLVLKRI